MESAVIQFSLYDEAGKRSLEQCLAASGMIKAINRWRNVMHEIENEKLFGKTALAMLMDELEIQGVDINHLNDEV